MSPRKSAGTTTDRALARMMVEPTGRNILDSGGAYGRNWERAQGMTVESFLAQPAIAVETWSPDMGDDGWERSENGGVTLSLFHYLRTRLEYHHPYTMWLLRDGNRTDDPWLVSMEEWATKIHTGDPDDMWRLDTYNSFNHENLLSQTIQFTTFTRDGVPFLALQVHGGADVRGGYTAPKVFQVTTDEPISFLDWDVWEFGHEVAVTTGDELPGMPLPADAYRSAGDGQWYVSHGWTKESGSSNGWIERGGSYVTLPDLVWKRHEVYTGGVWQVECPQCGAGCEVYAPDAW
ncbi:MAG TPA: hypothetical protein VFQ06_09140 [Nitrospira sp.]|nr:hypothetical protein [Nitrospira sp.]